MEKSEETSVFKNSSNVEAIQTNWIIASGLFIIFILFCILMWVVFFILNTHQWSEILEKKIEYITRALTTAGLIFGGIVGAINVYFGAKRALAMENSAIAANRTAKAAVKNAQISEDKQITERFSKAIEQMASESNAIILGGIHTLERIAKDSPNDRWTTIEILTAFLRQKTRFEKFEKLYELEEDADIYEYRNSPLRIEKLEKLELFQEIITVIARLNSQKAPEGRALNLSNINLVLSRLKGANFKEANFERATLIQTNFEKADLTDANLTSTILRGSDFRGAILERINLSGANLEGADLRCANLTNSNLQYANLSRANLSGANLTNADLIRANLENAEMIVANLTKSNLQYANLSRANLDGANLTETDFTANQTIKLSQIKNHTKNWEKAKYDKDFRDKLALPPEEEK